MNSTTGPIFGPVQSFLTNNESTPTGKPKAYLNWLMLDEQLQPVSSYPQTGAIPVGAAGTLNPLGYTGIPVTKNGFIYIWVSNETPGWDVFFDNLSIKHYTGPILEETHYYPFGLTMSGISSKALKSGYAENKFKYNGKELQGREFNDGSGLEEYDYGARFYDAQIGRWHVIDSYSEQTESITPYNYATDNPISNIDYKGKFSICVTGDYLKDHNITDIAAFANTLLNFIDNVEQFGKDNPDVVNELVNSTGLSKDEVNNDLKSGNGPALILDEPKETFPEHQNPNEKTINLDILSFKQLSSVDKNTNQEEYNIQTFANIMYVLHEYSHYGDKKTNGGKNSGQIGATKYTYDLPESSDKTLPIQKSTAKTGHRGLDIESQILFKFIYANPYGINAAGQTRMDIIFENNGALNERTREVIKDSDRFKNRKANFK